MRRHAARVALVLLAAPAALLPGLPSGLVAASAQGAAFCDGAGVSVVVDFGALEGGVVQECVEDGAGRTAAEVFEDAGFELTPVGAFPGAACRVDGKPRDAACAQMPPADAYWGLFLAGADGWAYAPKGADELVVEDGAFVAFAWQDTEQPTRPRVQPAAGAIPSGDAAPDGPAEEAVEDTQEAASQGISLWVPVLAMVALLAGIGAFVVTRRRPR